MGRNSENIFSGGTCECKWSKFHRWKLNILNLKSKISSEVENLNVSLNFILNKNEKVEHHIRIMTHKSITLRFWIENNVNTL